MTTIQVKKELLEQLKDLKKYPRETYNDLIVNLVSFYLKNRRINQYDEFLHKIQQHKMRELWDNEYDEVWDDA